MKITLSEQEIINILIEKISLSMDWKHEFDKNPHWFEITDENGSEVISESVSFVLEDVELLEDVK